VSLWSKAVSATIESGAGNAGPEVSVVIVTWNGRQYLDACLQAVAAQRGVAAETILVDNASTDGTVSFVREQYPWVRVVALGEAGMFSAQIEKGEPFGMNVEGIDNKQLVLNVVHWLSRLL